MHAKGQYRYYTGTPFLPPHMREISRHCSDLVHMRHGEDVAVHFLNWRAFSAGPRVPPSTSRPRGVPQEEAS